MRSDHRNRPCAGCARQEHFSRRAFLGQGSAALAAVLAACSSTEAIRRRVVTPSVSPQSAPSTTTSPTQPPVVVLDQIPSPSPGPPIIITNAPFPTPAIALTIDDGYCESCVTDYVSFAQQSGIHITFSPNGAYAPVWEPHADLLRSLIAAGQVQIGNHTYTHASLVGLSDSRVEQELEKNDEWIQKTFGITSRPWYRPPYGFHNARVDDIAGSLGYTKVLMWSGTLGDATVESPEELMGNARRYLQPGQIVLGHANHPTVTTLFGQIQSLIEQRALDPVTLDEMFGTSRNKA